MAKSEVAVDLKSTVIFGMGVQVPLPAPNLIYPKFL